MYPVRRSCLWSRFHVRKAFQLPVSDIKVYTDCRKIVMGKCRIFVPGFENAVKMAAFLDKVTKLLQSLTNLFDFPAYLRYNNVGYVSVAMEVDIYGFERA